MSNVAAPERAHTTQPPTPREIADVDAGLNDRLAAASLEPLHHDPAVTALQADRDRCAYRGDFERADKLADRADAMAAYLVRRDRERGDVERER